MLADCLQADWSALTTVVSAQWDGKVVLVLIHMSVVVHERSRL